MPDDVGDSGTEAVPAPEPVNDDRLGQEKESEAGSGAEESDGSSHHVDEYEDSDSDDLYEPEVVSEEEGAGVEGRVSAMSKKQRKRERRKRNAKKRRRGISYSERHEDNPYEEYDDNEMLDLMLRKTKLSSKKAFVAVVKKKSRYFNKTLNWDKEAIEALHGMVEMELSLFFQHVSMATVHAKRKTTNEKDVELYKNMTGNYIADSKESRKASREVARACRNNEDDLDRMDGLIQRKKGSNQQASDASDSSINDNREGDRGDASSDGEGDGGDASSDGEGDGGDEHVSNDARDVESDWSSMDSDDESIEESEGEE